MLVTTPDPELLALDEVDLYPAAFYRDCDPHAAWKTLRAKAPVWRQSTPEGTEFWSVTRYQDVVDVLRNTQQFSSAYSTMLTVLGDGDTAQDKAIHLMDPPRHSDVRSAAIPALSVRVMREREPAVRQRIRALVDAAVAAGGCDFAKVAAALPMAVAGELMGIPEHLWPEAAHWTVASMAPEDPAYSSGDARTTLLQAHVFLFSMFSDLIAMHRQAPGSDLVSMLTQMSVGGQPATDEEILVNCYAFIMGAIPTVPQAAAHLMLVAAQNPMVWKRVRDDTSLVPTAAEETLRWASPVNHLLRRANQHIRLGDETIPPGGLVVAWLASANRDESVFAEPFVFDPARKPNSHVAFGYGAHRCIGNTAAQLALQLLIAELATRVEAVELTGAVGHLESNFLNGITSLPVRLHEAGRP